MPSRSQPEVLVIGNANPDLVLTGEDLVPEFAQAEKTVSSADLVLGGSAAIVACGLARRAVAFARSAEATTSVDTNWDPSTRTDQERTRERRVRLPPHDQ